jgi:hypothetical protein
MDFDPSGLLFDLTAARSRRGQLGDLRLRYAAHLEINHSKIESRRRRNDPEPRVSHPYTNATGVGIFPFKRRTIFAPYSYPCLRLSDPLRRRRYWASILASLWGRRAEKTIAPSTEMEVNSLNSNHSASRLLAALIIATAFVFFEAAAGFLANSLAHLSDAGHNLANLATPALSWVRNAAQPAPGEPAQDLWVSSRRDSGGALEFDDAGLHRDPYLL